MERRAKTHGGTVELAAKLRRETMMTMARVARRLRMGARNTLSAKSREWRKTHEHKKT